MLTRAVSSAGEHRPYKARATGSIPVPPILVIVAGSFGFFGTSSDPTPRPLRARCYSWCYFGAPIEPLDGVVELPRREVRVALRHARGGVAEEVADVLDVDPGHAT